MKKRDRDNKDQALPVLRLPYISTIANRIRRLCQKLDIRLVCSSSNTIRSILCHPKDPIKPMDQINVIYKISCKDCSKSYVGETGRRLEDRKRDHQAAVKRGDMDKNAIAYHCWNQDHTMDWNGTKRLSTEDQRFRRRIKESIWIRKEGDINQDDGTSNWEVLLPSLLPKLRESAVSPVRDTRKIRQSGSTIHHLSGTSRFRMIDGDSCVAAPPRFPGPPLEPQNFTAWNVSKVMSWNWWTNNVTVHFGVNSRYTGAPSRVTYGTLAYLNEAHLG